MLVGFFCLRLNYVVKKDLILNFLSSCFLFLSARIAGVHHHHAVCLCNVGEQIQGFLYSGKALSVPTEPHSTLKFKKFFVVKAQHRIVKVYSVCTLTCVYPHRA